jgi:hypothetical protein
MRLSICIAAIAGIIAHKGATNRSDRGECGLCVGQKAPAQLAVATGFELVCVG